MSVHGVRGVTCVREGALSSPWPGLWTKCTVPGLQARCRAGLQSCLHILQSLGSHHTAAGRHVTEDIPSRWHSPRHSSASKKKRNGAHLLALRLCQTLCHGTVAGSPYLRLPRLAEQLVYEDSLHHRLATILNVRACRLMCTAPARPSRRKPRSRCALARQGRGTVGGASGIRAGPRRTSAPQATCPRVQPRKQQRSKVLQRLRSARRKHSGKGSSLALLALRCSRHTGDSAMSPVPVAAKTRKSKGVPRLPFRELLH